MRQLSFAHSQTTSSNPDRSRLSLLTTAHSRLHRYLPQQGEDERRVQFKTQTENWLCMQKEAAHSKFVVADGRNVLLLQLGRVIGAPKGHCIHGSGVEPAVKHFGRSISVLQGVVSRRTRRVGDLAQGAGDRLPAEGGLGGGVSSDRRCDVIGSSGHGLERIIHAHLVEGEPQRLHSTAAAQAVSAVCPAAGMDSSSSVETQGAGGRGRLIAREGLARVGSGHDMLHHAAIVTAQQPQEFDQ